MTLSPSRRGFLRSALAATAACSAGSMGRVEAFAAVGKDLAPAPANKRDAVLALLEKGARQTYVPAAFFIHFDNAFHFGPPAVQKHLEYFRYTDMDFVKIQYERIFPSIPGIKRPEDWKTMPSYKLDFYEPMLSTVDGLVKAAKKEALVIVTLYSPYMCAGHTTSLPLLRAHLSENPDAVGKGLDAITASLMRFVKECIRLGVDGFYASTQGGEAGTFRDAGTFARHVKPFDLVLMNEMNRRCPFNILHVCDYNAPYTDLSEFTDYPGHVVNCNPQLTGRTLAWGDIARLFGRPCMGGIDRHGPIATAGQEEVGRLVKQALDGASRPFILGADCTLPGDIKWETIRATIAAAHQYRLG
jgi:uroporphyrinogen decarboxylase